MLLHCQSVMQSQGDGNIAVASCAYKEPTSKIIRQLHEKTHSISLRFRVTRMMLVNLALSADETKKLGPAPTRIAKAIRARVTSTTTRSPGSKQPVRQDLDQPEGTNGRPYQEFRLEQVHRHGNVQDSSTTRTNGKTASRQGSGHGDSSRHFPESKAQKPVFNGKTSTIDLTKTKTATGSSTTGTITGPNRSCLRLEFHDHKDRQWLQGHDHYWPCKGGQTTIDTTVAKTGNQTVKTTDVTLAYGKTDNPVSWTRREGRSDPSPGRWRTLAPMARDLHPDGGSLCSDEEFFPHLATRQTPKFDLRAAFVVPGAGFFVPSERASDIAEAGRSKNHCWMTRIPSRSREAQPAD